MHILQAIVAKIKQELVPKVLSAQLTFNTTLKAFSTLQTLSSLTRNATAALIRPVCQAQKTYVEKAYTAAKAKSALILVPRIRSINIT